LQEKQPFERIEVTRDQALEIFSDNKFKASTLTLLFLTLVFLSFVPRSHIDLKYVPYFRSPIINDMAICCLGCIALVIRSKLSMICPLIRL